MKIAVLDIETTGFTPKWDAIVEIGITLVDTEKKTLKLIFNKVINDDIFDINKGRHNDAWIFKNSDLKIEDVVDANTLEDYREELQSIFDKYPVTAFNSSFDFKFMDARDFKIEKLKCLMHTSKKYVGDGKKWPSVIKTYKQFFPEETKWDEKHRGGDDSLDEGKILLKLCELREKRQSLIKG